MMIRILCFLLLAQITYAQGDKITPGSKISSVTVFLDGAQITRSVRFEAKAGRSTIILKSLSPYLDENTIQVKANSDVTLLSVRRQINKLSELEKSRQADSLQAIIDELENENEIHSGRLLVLEEKKELLFANRKISSEGPSLDELNKALELFDRELMQIENEKRTRNAQIAVTTKRINDLRNAINAVKNNKDLPSSEIMIQIESEKSTAIAMEVSYLVNNAGWFPSYDIRVKNVDSPIDLHYKAEVYQNTGVDWESVKLKFSNADPRQSGTLPDLPVWFINYQQYFRNTAAIYGSSVPSGNIRQVSGTVYSAEDSSPLPGVNVVVKGTTVGTVTDLNGNYSLSLPATAESLVYSFVGFINQEQWITQSHIDVELQTDVQQLQEVVVTGYSPGVTIRGLSSKNRTNTARQAKSEIISTIVNQTTVEFQVDRPYSLPSDGEKRTVEMTTYNVPASYEYYAVPKLDKDAFLVARIINWNDFHLLEGQANLYFEDAYVGRTVLNARTISDTLDLSLGRDRSIVIGRNKIDEFSKNQSIGSNTRQSIGFEILVKNNKSSPISITLFDQIPKSVNNNIQVDAEELSGGKIDEENNKIRWSLVVDAGKQQTLSLKYSVKYPKSERVILE